MDRNVAEVDIAIQSQIKDKPLGTKRDVLISYSTIPGKSILMWYFSDSILWFSTGYVSIRIPENGSWFIQTLCKVFNENVEQAHLEDLLKITSKELRELMDHNKGIWNNFTILIKAQSFKLFQARKRVSLNLEVSTVTFTLILMKVKINHSWIALFNLFQYFTFSHYFFVEIDLFDSFIKSTT